MYTTPGGWCTGLCWCMFFGFSCTPPRGGGPTHNHPKGSCKVASYFYSPEEVEQPRSKREVQSAANIRHRLWLQSCEATSAGSNTWRPIRIYRSSTQRWVEKLDNSLQVCTAWKGLRTIQPDWSKPKWHDSSWRTWPRGLSTQDKAGDGLSAMSALKFKPSLKLNVIEYFDFAHLACRSLEEGFRSVGLWSFTLLMLVVFNLPHGPEKEEGMRWAQFTETLSDMVAKFEEPSNFELFKAHLHRMAIELRGIIDFEKFVDQEDAVWEYVKTCERHPIKDSYKVKLGEFMAWPRAAEAFIPVWTLWRFVCEYVAVEMGMISSKAALKIIEVPTVAAKAAAETKTTDASITQIDTRVLRSACQNAVVCTLAVTSQEPLRRQMVVMARIPSPLSHWEGTAAKDMESVPSNHAWILEQLGKGFMEHQFETLGMLANEQFMRDAGFTEFATADPNDLHGRVVEDDAFAHTAGVLALSLCGAQQRRLSYLQLGYPHSLSKLNLSDDVANVTTKNFEMDLRIFQKVANLGVRRNSLDTMFLRSPFQLTSVKQYVAGFVDTATGFGFAPHKDVKVLAKRQTHGIITTVPVERVNGYQKNHAQIRGSPKMRRMEKAWAVSINQNIIGNIFKYNPVVPIIPVVKKTVQLDKNSFVKRKAKSSIDLRGIASKVQKASWHSPAAENHSIPVGDLFMLRAWDLDPCLDLSLASLGIFCKVTHNLVFRRPGTPKSGEITWHAALFHWQGSAVCGWPVDIKRVPGAAQEEHVVDFLRTAADPHVFDVCNWKDIRVRGFKWRSPAWQERHFPRNGWPLAVRAFCSTPETTLVKLGGGCGWWDFSVSELKMVARCIGWDVPDKASLYQTLSIMTRKGYPTAGARDVLRYMSPRLTAEPREAEVQGVLLEVDEAASCLDRGDEDKIKKQKVASENLIIEYHGFVEQWAAAKREIVAKEAVAKAKAKPKAKAAAARLAPAPRVLPPFADMPETAAAKEWMPPHSADLWKSRGDGAWHSHVPPFPSCNRAVALWGHRALRIVISDAWRKFCLLEGISLDECPMQGLERSDETAPVLQR